MRRLVLVLLVPLCASAQNLADTLKQGEQIFAQSCSAGYCHGTKGSGGGGPRLVGRGLDQTYIRNTVTRGVDQTAMPAFGASMSRAEIAAVVAYVATLNGIANPTIAAAPRGGPERAPGPQLSGDALRGRELFSEATRGFRRCSSCHEVDGIGIPVAAPISTVPASVAALRSLATAGVVTASMDGESMPAVVLRNTKSGAIFYDLTAALPVMRTVDPGGVKFTDGNPWQHSSALSGYKDDDLNAILAYLRAVIKP